MTYIYQSEMPFLVKLTPEIHPAANADIFRFHNWLRENNCSFLTLDRFHLAIGEAYQKIKNNPETWSKVSTKSRVRKVQIKSFRMTVFYIIRKNGVPLILEFAGPGMQPRWAYRL